MSDKTFTICLLPDAVKDEEIENWAAKKIQNSFKQYKYHKTMSLDKDGDDLV